MPGSSQTSCNRLALTASALRRRSVAWHAGRCRRPTDVRSGAHISSGAARQASSPLAQKTVVSAEQSIHGRPRYVRVGGRPIRRRSRHRAREWHRHGPDSRPQRMEHRRSSSRHPSSTRHFRGGVGAQDPGDLCPAPPACPFSVRRGASPPATMPLAPPTAAGDLLPARRRGAVAAPPSQPRNPHR